MRAVSPGFCVADAFERRDVLAGEANFGGHGSFDTALVIRGLITEVTGKVDDVPALFGFECRLTDLVDLPQLGLATNGLIEGEAREALSERRRDFAIGEVSALIGEHPEEISLGGVVGFVRATWDGDHSLVDGEHSGPGRWIENAVSLRTDVDITHRARAKLVEVLSEEIEDDAGFVVEADAESIACGADHVEALRGFVAVDSRVDLADGVDEPAGLLGAEPLEVVDVARVRDELFQLGDDAVIGEKEPTVPLAVVSRAAHRVAVHDPHHDRLARLLRVYARLGEV